ncbi:MAG: 30S ribosomal protein S17 [Candidatus Omnitrophica bacterium CG11_big_fil_rev_8_21_14_0_20_42_13]|uniref:Small ribosomal subunit protein uS17 n=1 Tax=Candidatus Ghiorseimicrobium undicola TaxID=1974746 RepID=A0A2H0LVD9_9BACT|nr:MAG: 30S ribosomal protein S17 [Candidatus Omnitrophica bacterium CG11_big_fil_rev_8_21_14_0_20_42_13]
MTNVRAKRKERIGYVTSDKMQKTIVVRVEMAARHPAYKKIIKKYNKFKVHDENNTAKIGDRVRIMETRPLSKDKYWRLIEVLK